MPDSAQLSQWLQPDFMEAAGTWVGLIVSLLVFSAIFGDHWLARLGQAILVGAGLGYAAAITWQAVAGLPFVQGLLAAPLRAPWNWIPIVLALLLVLAAGERIIFQGEGGPPPGGFRRWLRWGGVLPAALLLGAGIAVIAAGTVQGTLLPQFLAAARTGIQWETSLEAFFTGLLTLVITASALVFWGLDPQRHLDAQPPWVQRLMRGWVWFGQRAVWFAAGVLFARLAASRTSLLIAQLDFIRSSLMATEVWRTLQGWWGG
jgi:hypothetical protein